MPTPDAGKAQFMAKRTPSKGNVYNQKMGRDLFTGGAICLGDEEFRSNFQCVAGRLTSRKTGRRKIQ